MLLSDCECIVGEEYVLHTSILNAAPDCECIVGEKKYAGAFE